VALIDLFEDPAESAGLVCVGGALTGSRFAGRAHLGDLILTGLEDARSCRPESVERDARAAALLGNGEKG
jgi:hypothetical protein